MYDKKYDIVVAMVTVLRTKIEYVHHMEERLFSEALYFSLQPLWNIYKQRNDMLLMILIIKYKFRFVLK